MFNVEWIRFFFNSFNIEHSTLNIQHSFSGRQRRQAWKGAAAEML